jgi:immune inhibitor A
MLRNTTKVISILAVLAMLVGAFAVLVPAIATNSASIKIVEPEPMMEIDRTMKTAQPNVAAVYNAASSLPAAYAPGAFYNVSDHAMFYTDGYGRSSFMDMVKRGDGAHCEMWVAVDLNFSSPADPRNNRVMITDEQVSYMIGQFDNVIYPRETAFFGNSPQIDGTNSLFEALGYPFDTFQTNVSGKVMIMVFNIVDQSFYDPGYPSYIAGYYWGIIDQYYDRNIINIDCYDWTNRTTGDAPRPYVYEATIAHEYQHLLNDFINPAQATFLNEGCSMYAEMLCGYGADMPAYFVRFLATPDNSLVDWGDQGDINILADYGAAAMFIIYISDHFGPGMVQDLVNTTESGIPAVNAAFVRNDLPDWSFDRLFQNWRLANLIHANAPGKGWYNYASISIGSDWLQFKEWDSASAQWVWSRSAYFGDTFSYEGYDTGVNTVGAYGTDYVIGALSPTWSNSLDLIGLTAGFAGQTGTVIQGWQQVPYGDHNIWWSGTGIDLGDFKLVTETTLPQTETVTLAFDTWYDIEPYYDFGFVQVSNDSGSTWTSLANEYTTSDYSTNVPAEINSLPGLTGYSGGWITPMMFDLSPWAGQDVMLRFRYMTDQGTTYEGWYVDNIKINDVSIPNDAFTTTYPVLDWMVSLYFPGGWSDGQWYNQVLINLDMNHVTEQVMKQIEAMAEYPYIVFVVSPNIGGADYAFGITNGID